MGTSLPHPLPLPQKVLGRSGKEVLRVISAHPALMFKGGWRTLARLIGRLNTAEQVVSIGREDEESTYLIGLSAQLLLTQKA